VKKYTQWYEVALHEQADGSFIASVIHYGNYEYLHEAYDFLIAWVKKNNYKIKNPSPLGEKESIRQIYLIDSHSAKKKEEFQTKLEVEIIKIVAPRRWDRPNYRRGTAPPTQAGTVTPKTKAER
jgi:ribosomal protein S10